MRSASRWATIFLAVTGLGVLAIPAHGEEPSTQPSSQTEATGTITGTVMKDGKPVANVRVGLIDAAQIKQGRGKCAKGQTPGDTTQTKQRQRPTPTATTMTDSEGKFILNEVKAGDYAIIANEKGEGRGRSRISVVAGQTQTIEVQLTQPAGGKAGKQGGGKANNTANAN